jgi:hypothetical protein
MPEKDPTHWLYRLSPPEWLQAADNELRAAQEAFLHKQQRPAVAHARRAAGMAWNALLWLLPEEKYGRSYMEHLQALKNDDDAPPELRAAAAKLVGMPMSQELVVLGAHGDPGQADCAALVIEHARKEVHRLMNPVGKA